MTGKFIGVKQNHDTFTVEKTFTLERGERAVLRATALGLYFAEINGKRVGRDRMTPGWTSYRTTLQYQEYDVTDYLQAGKNTLSFTVSGGWFCSGLGFNSAAPRLKYGEKAAVCAELQIGEKTVFTDTDWTARESYIRSSGIYDGETQDFIRPLACLDVVEVKWEKSVLVKQTCEAVRDIEKLPVKEIILTPKGERVYDFGQNLTGVAEIETEENFDGTIVLQFSEILMDGNFFDKGTRSAKATDTFTVKGAKKLCPEFTFHGFRYMKMTGAELPADKVFAVVRHTDLKRTGYISSSNELVQKLMDNIVWGQRDNFLDIPTDCPQRDERMGWTGDANVFLGTAALNYDVRRFFKKWLRDLRNDQAETGEIPQVVPDILGWKNTATVWCDSVCMIPWTLYEIYGDESFLTENYAAMKKYLVAVERTLKNGIVAQGQQYGDWLALDNEHYSDDGCHGRTDSYYIATVFYAECLKITAYTAEISGEKEYAAACREKRAYTVKRMREEYFTAGGRLAFDTVTAQTLALHFHIVPEEFRVDLAARLNANVIAHGYRAVTGIIGTRYLLFALADNGYSDTAGKVLLNEECPGWLYEVRMGATTMWERWDSILPDGSPKANGMNSFNHYFFGSVMEFVYRRICGIDFAAPGFKKIKISPAYVPGIDEIHAEYDSVNGKIRSGYRVKNGRIEYFATLPKGVPATFVLPGEEERVIKDGAFTCIREIGTERI